ncbi:MAG TPA: autotransporter-associated beta strand repeat-containing protein, partial [Thermoanaerobaculia bacterium]|nr:autotransporter-associated beta strand repeat-containing protein [Thermoanaerobaculia bacterium]
VTTAASNSTSSILSPGNLALGSASRTFTVADGSAPDDLVVSATVTGVGVGIIKAGPGRMVLSTNNSYNGITTVNAGSLIVDGMQQFSNAVVNSGGTLGGSGTVRNITANAGGIVSPGASPGILSAGPTVVLNAGSTFEVELYGTTPGTLYDQLNVTSTVTLGATLSVTLGFTPMVGNTFTIIQAATSVTGTFAGLPEGATFCVDTATLQIHYTATSVTLSVIALDTTAPTVTAPPAATVTQTTCQ